ncbi:MAG: dipeptide ABC transporter ATP-binding protein [Alphaproteobacteria bacterium]|nr:dipeptide ABC transporter ATP-binding protein [Alphaproteobacteria bacterium]
MTATPAGTPLLEIEGLRVHFPIRRGWLGARGVIRAVDGVSLTMTRGETLGLVGESGCGKSTLGNAVLRIVEPTGGEIRLEGVDLARLDREALRAARRRVQMVFQDPFASLDPRMRVGDSIGEPLLVHGLAQGDALRERVADLLVRVGLAATHADRYPHEFSGGQRQRLVIARALALSPALVVCDEPVSALDVSVRGQILNLLLTLQRELGTTFLFISHDLSVVRHVSDRIAVMYLGRIVELAKRDALFDAPRHPYTQALISAIPLPDPRAQRARRRMVLTGEIPSPANPPSGCAFHTRCPFAVERCRREAPVLTPRGSGALVACHLAE